MVVAQTRAALSEARDGLSGRVAVVMTMGALHAGHLRLIERAREQADAVIVTIFVNPLQFSANEDLSRYPRTLEGDLELCVDAGVDVVFTPSESEMYPPGEVIERLSAGALGGRLEGEVRPTHFDGVVTVVAMLLRLTRPDLAFFGEKDAQQLALIRAMVAEQEIPVRIVGVEIVREPDGLAMSSRNRFLDTSARSDAQALSRALHVGAEAAQAGAQADAVATRVREELARTPAVGVDYVAVVDENTWLPADLQTRRGRILVAGRVGSTRLIDNVSVVLGTHVPAG